MTIYNNILNNNSVSEVKKDGFQIIDDSGSNSINVFPDDLTVITNDNAGENSNSNFLPTGVSNFYDQNFGDLGYLNINELELGDVLNLKIDLSIIPQLDPVEAEIVFQFNYNGSNTIEKSKKTELLSSIYELNQTSVNDFFCINNEIIKSNYFRILIKSSNPFALLKNTITIAVNKRG